MSLYFVIFGDASPSADVRSAAAQIVEQFSTQEDAPMWFVGDGFLIVHSSRISTEAAEAVWERRYNEQTATALLCAVQRDNVLVALRACVGSLEFFEEAGFNGGCTLALAAARGAISALPSIP